MAQEEEILGKAYDSRLMKRLLTYLRPYWGQVTIALVSIVLKAFADVSGPYLVKVAIDKYLAPAKGAHSFLGDHLSARPLTGIAQIGGIYVGLLVFAFALEYLQTYYMQWTGQLACSIYAASSSAIYSACTWLFMTRTPSGASLHASLPTWTP